MPGAGVEIWAAGSVSLVPARDLEMVLVEVQVMNSGDRIFPLNAGHDAAQARAGWGRAQVLGATPGEVAGLLGAALRFMEFRNE